jgi:hypothetical protein
MRAGVLPLRARARTPRPPLVRHSRIFRIETNGERIEDHHLRELIDPLVEEFVVVHEQVQAVNEGGGPLRWIRNCAIYPGSSEHIRSTYRFWRRQWMVSSIHDSLLSFTTSAGWQC